MSRSSSILDLLELFGVLRRLRVVEEPGRQGARHRLEVARIVGIEHSVLDDPIAHHGGELVEVDRGLVEPDGAFIDDRITFVADTVEFFENLLCLILRGRALLRDLGGVALLVEPPLERGDDVVL